jgi:hypothetical protein
MDVILDVGGVILSLFTLFTYITRYEIRYDILIRG